MGIQPWKCNFEYICGHEGKGKGKLSPPTIITWENITFYTFFFRDYVKIITVLLQPSKILFNWISNSTGKISFFVVRKKNH